MKVLFKNFEKRSGQAGDNARKQWNLSDVGHTKESVDHYTSRKIRENYPAKWRIMLENSWT